MSARWIAVPLALALALVACAGRSPVGTVRFHNQPVVWKVNDREHVADKPAERTFAQYLYDLDAIFVHALTRVLDVRAPRRAANTNALDEVPDSTWFTNRIGTRDMTPEEVARGPNREAGPEAHKPWTVLGTKVGGASVGFLIADARGEKYLLKFDDKAIPEIETAADVIAQRILWSAGYNTPEDRVVDFEPGELVLADKATVKDVFGNKRRMKPADLADGLSKVYREPGKPIRALVSRYLPGVPIGGPPQSGTRADDPNDLIRHEDRRDLRGYRAIASWLGSTDIKEGNTLDMWIEDPRDPKRRYVVHYLVDFGKALGTMATADEREDSGFAHSLDLHYIVATLPTFGLWRRPWEPIADPGIRGIGLFEADKFRPDRFRTNLPYFPFKDADRFDGFWGAKIVMRFTEAHLRAVVAEARYSDPRATEYMVKTLIARQRKVGRYYFARVAPLDRFSITGGALCFDDLSLVYGLDPAADTSYAVAGFGYDGRGNGWRVTAPAADGGHICLDGVQPGSGPSGYVMVRIVTRRGGALLPATVVHLAREFAGGPLRVIGVWRQ